jgi:hypothetical protein
MRVEKWFRASVFVIASMTIGACSEHTTISVDWTIVRNGAPIPCEQSRVAFIKIDAYKDGTYVNHADEATESAVAPCTSRTETMEVAPGSYLLKFDGLDSGGVVAADDESQLVVVGEGDDVPVHVDVRAWAN